MSAPVPLDGVLRRLAAEQRRAERHRILDAVEPHLLAADRAHHLSKEGRLADGLRLALDLVQPGAPNGDDPPWTESLGTVSSAVDEAQVGVNLGEATDDGRRDEPWPVRIRVVDGAGPVVADLFLSADEADELAALLVRAAARSRDAGCLTPDEFAERGRAGDGE